MANWTISYFLGFSGNGSPTGAQDGSSVQLNLTYDPSAVNPDGSYTVTGASGTYTYIHAGPIGVFQRSQITGLAPAGSVHGNDNEIFTTGEPYVTGNGLGYVLDTGVPVDFYSATTGSTINYYEDNSSYATPNNRPASSVAAGPVCYCSGTLIRTVRGDVPVEELAIGECVVTLSGAHRSIKWIGRRSYAGRFANNNPHLLPVCFKAGSLADRIPARDLWVSPKHAMFLDGVLVPAEALVNDVSIVKAERADSVSYYHVELDTHDILVAEGAPSESFIDDNSRRIFQNWHEYYTLYPETEYIRAIYCAPRLEDGYELEATRRRLAERAGIPQASPCGALRGAIEIIAADAVSGWAQDERYPNAPICLDLVIDGVVERQVLANRYRADLAAAGVGDGCHGFEARLPPGWARLVEIRRSLDGAPLAYQPHHRRSLSRHSRVAR